jgi:hypothetical protein
MYHTLKNREFSFGLKIPNPTSVVENLEGGGGGGDFLLILAYFATQTRQIYIIYHQFLISNPLLLGKGWNYNANQTHKSYGDF